MIDYDLRGFDQLRNQANRYRRAYDRYPRLFRDFALTVGRIVLRGVQNEAPEKTGRLKSGLDVQVSGGGLNYDVKVVSAAHYTNAVLKGSRAHVIKPKRADGRLKFEANGTLVFAREVRHPGTRPNPFDRRGVESVRPEMLRRLEELKRRVFE